jgi:hypothetical protein
MASLQSLRPAPSLSIPSPPSIPPSVTEELVTVVRQLKRKVDDLTERSEKLEALVDGGAAPRKKRAVKGKANKAQLTPAVGEENGGAGLQKSAGKERAHVEGDGGGDTATPGQEAARRGAEPQRQGGEGREEEGGPAQSALGSVAQDVFCF